MDIVIAKREVSMVLRGTCMSIEIAKGGFKNQDTGEVSKPNWKLVFSENIGNEENPKLEMTKIKLADIENEKDALKLNDFMFKNLELSNIKFGQYKDNNNVYQDWYKINFNDIKIIENKGNK